MVDVPPAVDRPGAEGEPEKQDDIRDGNNENQSQPAAVTGLGKYLSPGNEKEDTDYDIEEDQYAGQTAQDITSGARYLPLAGNG
jgi:hypothetical protein